MSNLDPGPQLHREVRAAFVLKGTSLGAWCRENGFNKQNARDALFGTWNGPKGRAFRARILKAAGLRDAV